MREGTESTEEPASRRSGPSRGRKQGNTFFGGMAVLTLGIMVVKLIGMFYKIPLGRIIGEQGNADFQNAYNIYSVLLTISTAGLPVAVSKMISEASTLQNEGEVQRIFMVSLKFFLFLGGVSCFIMSVFSEQLALMVGDSLAAPGIRALAPAVIFVSVISAFRGYFQGKGFMTPTAFSQIIEALCKLILGLSLAYYIMNLEFTTADLDKYRKNLDYSGFSEEELQLALESTQASQAAAGAIMGVTVGTALALAFLFGRYVWGGGLKRHRRKREGGTELDIIKSLLSIAIPITITSSTASILNVLDASLVQWQLQNTLMMTENESRTLYGNYAYALNIYNLPLSLITAVTISVIPAVSGALAKKERKRGATIAISALRMTALLGMPMGMGIFVLGEQIIMLLYPEADIALAGGVLSSLGFVSSFVCLSLVCTSILQVYGFFYLPVLISFMGGLIKVTSNFILVGIPSVGIYGAPMGHLLCFSFCFFVSFSILLKVVPGLNRSYSLFFKPLFASLVMGGATWATYGFTSWICGKTSLQGEIVGTISGTGNAICTFLSIFVAVGVYLALILLVGGVQKSDVLMMPKGEKLARILRLD